MKDLKKKEDIRSVGDAHLGQLFFYLFLRKEAGMPEDLLTVFVKEDLDRDTLDPETDPQYLLLTHMDKKDIQFFRESLS